MIIDNQKPTNVNSNSGVLSLTPAPRLLRLDSLLDEFAADTERRHEARQTGQPLGALTGLHELDEELGGALVPGIHVLHGTPGSGKTAFALQAAAQCRCPALYLSCEMMPLELLRRITARVTGTYLGRFKTGEIPPNKVVDLARQACHEAHNMAILDGTMGGVNPDVLCGFLDVVRQIEPSNSHLLLVVDSVHAWVRGWQADATEYDALNAGIDALRQISVRYECAVLAIGERNRASMKTGGQNAAAGTRTFEYSAETVMDIQIEGNDTSSGKPAPNRKPVPLDITPIVLTLEKNRHGVMGKPISLAFEGRIQEFRER